MEELLKKTIEEEDPSWSQEEVDRRKGAEAGAEGEGGFGGPTMG